jgi:hypothetical protein
LDVQRGRVLPEVSHGNGGHPQNNEIEAVVDLADSVTSQSRHSLVLQGSPPSGKLLIPFDRRDVRVVEGARLESVCRGNSTEGSNPSLSAKLRFASLRLTERVVFRPPRDSRPFLMVRRSRTQRFQRRWNRSSNK